MRMEVAADEEEIRTTEVRVAKRVLRVLHTFLMTGSFVDDGEPHAIRRAIELVERELGVRWSREDAARLRKALRSEKDGT